MRILSIPFLTPHPFLFRVFPLRDFQGASVDAVVTLWDWDAVGKNDEIGRIRIPAARLTDLFRAELGSAAEDSFPVMQGGKPVVGHDKNQTQLKVPISYAPFSCLDTKLTVYALKALPSPYF